ncbi:hypothetical protein KJ785_03835, partial [Patescibacteria group bacterium]|nr:hypothetical protein [Patescibacteria group bacterium]
YFVLSTNSLTSTRFINKNKLNYLFLVDIIKIVKKLTMLCHKTHFLAPPNLLLNPYFRKRRAMLA